MTNLYWHPWIEECRKQELPVVPTLPEPWFSAQYVCANFLMIERVSDFVASCKAAGVPVLRINRKPLIRFSDVEKLGIE